VTVLDPSRPLPPEPVHQAREAADARVAENPQPAAEVSASAPAWGTRWWAWSLLIVAFLGLWVVGYLLVLSGMREHASQGRLYARFRADLAGATAPVGGLIKPGTPVALLQASRAGINDEVVVEGTTSAQTVLGPGHFPTSPLPGQPGVSLIFGRSLSYGAPFGEVASMKPGDQLSVTTGQGSFVYRVEDVRRAGSPLPALLKAGQSRLTLVSSAGSGWDSAWAPDHVVYVDASLVKGAVQVAPAAVTAVSADSRPMKSYTGSLVSLLLWLEALVIVAVAAAWTWVRWGRWQTWMAGVPLVLACLWGATGAASLLLPNLV